MTDDQFMKIKHDFITLSMKFNKDKCGRKRFPLYQHLLVDLMEKYNVKIPYFIPRARTKIRRKGIENILVKINLVEI